MSALRNENYEYDRLYYSGQARNQGGQARQADAAREVRRGSNTQKRNVGAKGNVRYINAAPAQQPRRRTERPEYRPAKENTRQRQAAERPAQRVREQSVAIPMQDAREAAAQKRTAIKNIATVLVVFVMLAIVVTRYAAISENNVENYELGQSVSETASAVKDLNLKLSLKDDLETIKETAATQMNMGFPEKDQTRYIEFAPMNTEQAEESAVEEDTPKGFIDVISGWFETVKGWFE